MVKSASHLAQVFASNPAQLCTTIDVVDDANQIRYHYSVQVLSTDHGLLLCSNAALRAARWLPWRMCTYGISPIAMHTPSLAQDTPGWEAIQDNMEPIVDYIQACNLKCLENEQVSSRCSRSHSCRPVLIARAAHIEAGGVFPADSRCSRVTACTQPQLAPLGRLLGLTPSNA